MSHRVGDSRWFFKKAARKSLALGAWATGSLAAARRLAAGPRTRVLTYHRFGDAIHDPFCVRRLDFEAHMRFLAENRLAVSLKQFEASLAGKKQLPDGSVLVTVDDGFQSVFTDMLPVLKHFAIPAVAFISPGLIDGGQASDGQDEPPEAYLGWDELCRLASEGIAIGAHGWTHRSLARMGPDETRDEAFRCLATLEDRLGCRVTSIAYPYGTRADFNHATADILAETGYTTAFTSQHGAVSAGADPLRLPRIKVEGGEEFWMFRLLCRGALDGWRLVDRTLWRVQQTP